MDKQSTKDKTQYIQTEPKVKKTKTKKLDIMKQIIDKSEECTYLEMNNNF